MVTRLSSKSFKNKRESETSKVEEVTLIDRVRSAYNKEYSIEKIAELCCISLREARYYYMKCARERKSW